MNRYVIVGAILGVLVPLAFFGAHFLSGYHYFFGPETVMFWPSSILLMATDGREATAGSFVVIVLSVLLNVLLYMLIAVIAFGIRKSVSSKTRNGPSE